MPPSVVLKAYELITEELLTARPSPASDGTDVDMADTARSELNCVLSRKAVTKCHVINHFYTFPYVRVQGSGN